MGNKLFRNVDIEVLTSLAGVQAAIKHLAGVQHRISGTYFDTPVTGRFGKITSTHSGSNLPLMLAEVVFVAKNLRCKSSHT